MSEFTGRSVLITGGNSGIGEATALAFGRAGARVAVVGRRTEANETVAARVREAGGQAIAVTADVTVEEQVQSAVRSTIDAFGGIDVAVNNAGTWRPGPFGAITPQMWADEVNANLTSVYYCMRHELPVMAEQGRGVILNNASVLGGWSAPRAWRPMWRPSTRWSA